MFKLKHIGTVKSKPGYCDQEEFSILKNDVEVYRYTRNYHGAQYGFDTFCPIDDKYIVFTPTYHSIAIFNAETGKVEENDSPFSSTCPLYIRFIKKKILVESIVWGAESDPFVDIYDFKDGKLIKLMSYKGSIDECRLFNKFIQVKEDKEYYYSGLPVDFGIQDLVSASDSKLKDFEDNDGDYNWFIELCDDEVQEYIKLKEKLIKMRDAKNA